MLPFSDNQVRAAFGMARMIQSKAREVGGPEMELAYASPLTIIKALEAIKELPAGITDAAREKYGPLGPRDQ